MIHGETQMNKVSRFVKEIPENLLEVENHSYGSKKSAISFGGKDSSESQGHFDFRANAKSAQSRYGSGTTTYSEIKSLQSVDRKASAVPMPQITAGHRLITVQETLHSRIKKSVLGKNFRWTYLI